MPFVHELLKYRSVAVVGMEKNCGKTECLNYILRNLPSDGPGVCVTSIGLDGERTDQVTGTAKPEIVLRSGMFFSTSETHYRSRRLVSEIVDVSGETTALGRLITARVALEGKVILSGPSSTVSLKRWMDSISGFGIGLTIIDGALSRKSSASPAVSEAMVLATGAALSCNMPALVDRTAFCVEMIESGSALGAYPDGILDGPGGGDSPGGQKGGSIRSIDRQAADPSADGKETAGDRGDGRGFYPDLHFSGELEAFCPCRRKASGAQADSTAGRMCQSLGSQRLPT